MAREHWRVHDVDRERCIQASATLFPFRRVANAMLDEKFLARLHDAFPEFYARVDEEARADASRLRTEAHGDVAKALSRARMAGAGRLWWPYVKGSVPFVRRERDAMEGFTKLVLTVGHIVGHDAGSMEAARAHVLDVLRKSLDYERLKDLVTRKSDDPDSAVAEAGIMASVTAMMAPLAMFRNARKYARFVPAPVRVAVAGVVVAALASVPLVAGYSAGRKAEDAARAASAIDVKAEPKKAKDVKRSA